MISHVQEKQSTLRGVKIKQKTIRRSNAWTSIMGVTEEIPEAEEINVPFKNPTIGDKVKPI